MNTETNIGKYLKFVYYTKSASGKTDLYKVINHIKNEQIGIVHWQGQWRKYCFLSFEDIEYDIECLRSIAEFLTIVNIEHKDKDIILDSKKTLTLSSLAKQVTKVLDNAK